MSGSYSLNRFDKDVPRFTLSDEEQIELDIYKKKLRIENEKYLRQHIELPILLQKFTRSVLKEQPTDIGHFASKFFAQTNLRNEIEQEISLASLRRQS
ncbi:RIIa domain-containing protein 1-like [Sycon ciliatum]|uniref:RIIa domain-containing protein 1-like n=1 Tax=Sycon ciliatum TaxID=27933 RepID=UPI0020AD9BC7